MLIDQTRSAKRATAKVALPVQTLLVGALALGASSVAQADSFVALSRLSASGALDATFSGDGREASNLPGTDETANAAVLDASGRLVVAGTVNMAGVGENVFVARYTAAGVLDTTFGSHGFTAIDFPTVGEEAHAVAIDHSGRIVVGGTAGEQFCLARFSANGVLDKTFGSGGGVITNFKSMDIEIIYDLVITPENQIVAAGIAFNGSPGFVSQFALARYNNDGSLDSHFDGDGKVLTDVTSSDDGAHGVVLQTDGKILAAGGVAGGKMGAVRYNTDGSVDTTYGAHGLAIISPSPMTSAVANAVALDSAGRLVLAGSAEDSNFNSSFALARLTTSGTLDKTFDSDGKVFTTGVGESIADLKLQTDGKIVVGGSGSNFIKGARYKTDGSVDTLFNTINILEKPVDTGHAVLLDAAGRIMILGETADPPAI